MMKEKIDGPKQRNSSQSLKLVAAVLLSLIAAWLLYRYFAMPVSKAQKRAFASLGEFAAEEFAKLVPSGRVLVVYDVPNKAAEQDPRSAPRIEMKGIQALAFKKYLAKGGKYAFAPDAQLARSAMAMNSEWPDGTFQKLLDMPDTALVLFSSLPALDSSQKNQIPLRTAKIVVVGMALPEIKPAVQARLVHLAISSRVPAPPGPTVEETPAAWARRIYVVVTPENADSAR